jgi:hypothetical protein
MLNYISLTFTSVPVTVNTHDSLHEEFSSDQQRGQVRIIRAFMSSDAALSQR